MSRLEISPFGEFWIALYFLLLLFQRFTIRIALPFFLNQLSLLSIMGSISSLMIQFLCKALSCFLGYTSHGKQSKQKWVTSFISKSVILQLIDVELNSVFKFKP